MNQEKEKAIVDFYLTNDISIAKMAKLPQFPSDVTISKILKKYQIEIKKRNHQKITLPIEEINQLYESGQSTVELAKIYKCSDETIRKHIKNPRNYSELNKMRGQDILSKISKSCKKKWQEPEYRKKVKKGTSTKKYLENHSQKSKQNWDNPNYRKKISKTKSTPEYKENKRKQVAKLWENPNYRKKQEIHFNWRAKKASEASMKALEDPKHREKWLKKLQKTSAHTRAKQPRISTQQKQLYYLLEQSKISFWPESPKTIVADKYVADCILPDHDLIIEVQGEYWHGSPEKKIKDQERKEYIEDNTDFTVLFLEELDFKSFETIKRKLSQYIDLKSIACKVQDLKIKKITEKTGKLFYETFHYSSTIRKGATTFGAFYHNNLVAAISYTPPIRQQVASSLNCELKELREISRLAIASNLDCKNLASWFISKTIKLLPKDIRVIVSYSDTTYGHTGTVYKASNFTQDKKIENNYHYENKFGEIFHKKTIWDRSKQMKTSEKEYAAKFNLHRVLDGPKYRFVRRLF